MANFDLLDTVLEQIKEWKHRVEIEPGLVTEIGWNQGSWALDAVAENWEEGYHCKTALCFAGFAVHNAGYRWLRVPDDQDGVELIPIREDKFDQVLETLEAQRSVEDQRIYADSVQPRSIGGIAKDVLGLTDTAGDRLFYASNTLEDIEEIIEEWRTNARAAGFDV
jgi:hypothetical protein